MTNVKIVSAINRLVPGAQINMIGDSLEGLKWLDDRPRPADVEIATEIDRQPIIDARTAAIQRIKTSHAQELQSIKDRYAQTEIDGWHELIADATNGGGSCIEAYAKTANMSVKDACALIIGANAAYRVAYGAATGTLNKKRKLIDAATTVEELNAIK